MHENTMRTKLAFHQLKPNTILFCFHFDYFYSTFLIKLISTNCAHINTEYFLGRHNLCIMGIYPK